MGGLILKVSLLVVATFVVAAQARADMIQGLRGQECSALFRPARDNEVRVIRGHVDSRSLEDRLMKLFVTKYSQGKMRAKIVVENASETELQTLSRLLRGVFEVTSESSSKTSRWTVDIVAYSRDVETLIKSSAVTRYESRVGDRINYRFETGSLLDARVARRAEFENPDLYLRFDN